MSTEDIGTEDIGTEKFIKNSNALIDGILDMAGPEGAASTEHLVAGMAVLQARIGLRILAELSRISATLETVEAHGEDACDSLMALCLNGD